MALVVPLLALGPPASGGTMDRVQTVTLDVPSHAIVGEDTEAVGQARATDPRQVAIPGTPWTIGVNGAGYPAQDVAILIDGVPRSEAQTALNGNYKAPVPVDGARGLRLVQAVTNEGTLLEVRSPVKAMVFADPPSPPTNVTVEPLPRSTALEVSWTPPTDDGGAELTGYTVEARVAGSGAWTQLGELGPEHRSVVHVTEAYETYEHRVRASSLAADGDASTPVETTAPDPHPSDEIPWEVQGISFCRDECTWFDEPGLTIYPAPGLFVLHTHVQGQVLADGGPIPYAEVELTVTGFVETYLWWRAVGEDKVTVQADEDGRFTANLRETVDHGVRQGECERYKFLGSAVYTYGPASAQTKASYQLPSPGQPAWKIKVCGV